MDDSGYGKYQANPAELRRAIDEILGVNKTAAAIYDDFKAAVDHTRDWYGVDDQYARQTRPQWDGEVEKVLATFGALRDAILGIGNGRLEELKSIDGAQSYAQENIDAAKAAVHNIGTDDDSSAGKH